VAQVTWYIFEYYCPVPHQIISIPGILLLLESDFGATIIVVATVLSMLLAAGVYLKQLFIVGGVIILSVISLISLNPNRVERFTSFWREDLWLNHSDKVWQTKQALVGIARGDWTGVGLGNREIITKTLKNPSQGCFKSFSCSTKKPAVNKIMTIFKISEGCSLNATKSIQRVDPLMVLPIGEKTTASNTMVIKKSQ
jgi:hypothetical protein